MARDGGATRSSRTSLLAFLVVAVIAVGTDGAVPATADTTGNPGCASGVEFLGFSDALDKQSFEGTEVGGLSGLTYDRRDTYYSLVDNGPAGDSPARFYTVEAPVDRHGPGTPEIEDATSLRDASGEHFTASNFDGEGIARERDGDLLASSETEPSIRRFSESGELLDELPVPQKFLEEGSNCPSA